MILKTEMVLPSVYPEKGKIYPVVGKVFFIFLVCNPIGTKFAVNRQAQITAEG
jgi:hypothetical protein